MRNEFKSLRSTYFKNFDDVDFELLLERVLVNQPIKIKNSMGAQKNYFDGVGMRFFGRVHIIFRTLWITIYFLQNLTSHWIVDTFRSFEEASSLFNGCQHFVFSFFPRNILVSSNKACEFSCSLSVSVSVFHMRIQLYMYICHWALRFSSSHWLHFSFQHKHE